MGEVTYSHSDRGGTFVHCSAKSANLRHAELRESTISELQAFEQAKLLRRVLRARIERTDYFSSRLFSEPAWDMLLELYAAHLMQRRLAVKDLCVASRVPQTTALRWITVLKSEGLIYARSDPLDARRTFLEFTPEGCVAMMRYFTAIAGRVWPQEMTVGNAKHPVAL